jgi:hypothetical protein
METPPTPIHVAPNVEVKELPTETFADDFDLNPDLYDDDDNKTQDGTRLNNESSSQLNTTITINDNNNGRESQLVSNNIQNDDYGTDIDYAVKSVTSPFDTIYQATLQQFSSTPNVLSDQQISKIVNYTDEELLKIQRKYIKSQAEDLPYDIYNLIGDLVSVVNILWVSITNKNRLFGQENYFIKILGDLEDYLDHYPLFKNIPPISDTAHQQVVDFFTFFQSLDVKLSCLIDGYTAIVGDKQISQKLTATEYLRLLPIVTRLRILIITKTESVKSKLQDSADGAAIDMADILDVEVGRLFEGILDRQS